MVRVVWDDVRTLGTTVATALGLLAGCSQAAMAQPRPDPESRDEVRALHIVGTKAIPASALRESVGTQASGCRSLLLRPLCWITKSPAVYQRRYRERDELARDLLRARVFYYRRGYHKARIDTTVKRIDRGAVAITLIVQEGPPLHLTESRIAVSPALVPPLDSARLLRPQVGRPLNLLVVDSTRLRVREALWERGYADAAVHPEIFVDSLADTATFRMRVTPGRVVTIDSIAIAGHRRVSRGTIRRALLITPGSRFRLSDVVRSQRALYESGLFERVTIDTIPRAVAADSTRSLIVRVQEGPPREARTSIGFTTADFIQAEGRFTHFNLGGEARRLELSATVGNLLARALTRVPAFVQITNIAKDEPLGRYYAPTYQASADLRQPWIGSPRNTLSAALFLHRRSSPGVFVDQGHGLQSVFTREGAVRVTGSAAYRFELTRVEAGDVYFCVNYGVCDAPTIGLLRGEQRLSPLAITMQADRSNAPFSPTRGYRIRGELEHASAATASAFHYHRALVDLAGYLPIDIRRAVLAGHFRIGFVQPIGRGGPVDASMDGARILHPRKRFYAGGAQSVRGFGENQLGPRVLTIDPALLPRDGADTVRSAPALRDTDFRVRPLGGTRLIEASVELRARLWRALIGAAFIDGAVLANDAVSDRSTQTAALTPGFGVRYASPVGPIRVDLGIRPTLRETLPVITEGRDSSGNRVLRPLQEAPCHEPGIGCRTFPDPEERRSFWQRAANRLTLHLSIGEAY